MKTQAKPEAQRRMFPAALVFPSVQRASMARLGLALSIFIGNATPARTQSPPQGVVGERRQKVNDPVAALRARADAAIEKKDYPAAVQALLEYVAARPSDPLGHFQLGYAYTAMEKWPEAELEYNKAIELDPKMAGAQLNLGMVRLNRDPAAAIEPLRKATELQPDQPRPRVLLALALERSGKLAEAVDQYQAAERLDDKNFEVHYDLGRGLLALNRLSEAETEFRRALALGPDTPAVHAGLAESLLAQNKTDEGVRELQAYLEGKPEDQDARLRLASILVDQKSYDRALEQLDHLVPGERSSLRASRLRAEVYIAQKQYDQAAATLEKAATLAPRDAELRARLGRVYLEKRDFPAAQRELNEALRINPQLTDALRDLMASYYLGKNYQAALAALDLLDKRVPPVAESWFVRATCYDRLGRKEEALNAYLKFLAMDQNHDDRQDFQAHGRARTLARELHKKEIE